MERSIHTGFAPLRSGRLSSAGSRQPSRLRNRNLQALLYAGPALSKEEKRQHSAAISRKLRLLRAHVLIQKLAHTHRYQVTEKGRLILTALLAAVCHQRLRRTRRRLHVHLRHPGLHLAR